MKSKSWGYLLSGVLVVAVGFVSYSLKQYRSSSQSVQAKVSKAKKQARKPASVKGLSTETKAVASPSIVAQLNVEGEIATPSVGSAEIKKLVEQMRSSSEIPDVEQQVMDFKREIELSGIEMPKGEELQSFCPKFPGACHLAAEEHLFQLKELRMWTTNTTQDGVRAVLQAELTALEAKTYELSIKACVFGNDMACSLAGTYAKTMEEADLSLEVSTRLCENGLPSGCSAATDNARSKVDLAWGVCRGECDESRRPIVEQAMRSFREVMMSSCRKGSPWSCQEVTRTFGTSSPGQAVEAEMQLQDLCKTTPRACEALTSVLVSDKKYDEAEVVNSGRCQPGNSGSCLRLATLEYRRTKNFDAFKRGLETYCLNVEEEWRDYRGVKDVCGSIAAQTSGEEFWLRHGNAQLPPSFASLSSLVLYP